MKTAILSWFIHGQTGISSEAMAAAVLGMNPSGKWSENHPSDPSDLNRCLLFLAAVPEARSHLDKVAKLSKKWERLINRWTELEMTFLKEVGFDWSKAKSAPITYNLMKSILDDTK